MLRASVRIRKSSPSCVQRRTHNDGVWDGLGEQRVWSSSQEAQDRSMRYWRYLCRCDLDTGIPVVQTVVRAPRSTPLTTGALPVGRRRAIPSPAGKLSFEFGTDGRCNNGARTTGMKWVKKTTKRESKLREYRRKHGVKAVDAEEERVRRAAARSKKSRCEWSRRHRMERHKIRRVVQDKLSRLQQRLS